MLLSQSKVYIYGAGKEYCRLYSYIKFLQEDIFVEAIVTTQKNKYRFIDGYPCIVVNEADFSSVDFVIIATVAWNEIYKILKDYGVDDSKIVLSTVFGTPYFKWREYIKLKASNVSILCNSCAGGLIYKELGLRFNSPTIASACFSDSFFDFLDDYVDFLSKPMECYIDEKSDYNSIGREFFFPKGIVVNSSGKKVDFLFPHSSSSEKSVELWNERRKRMNFDNVAAVVVITRDNQLERFEKLKIKKKIAVYYKDNSIDNVFLCNEWNNSEYRYKHDFNWPYCANSYFINSRGDASVIDWINFLNGESSFVRYEI